MVNNKAIDKLQYRADIDGLRAVAVLSVFFYHAGLSVFSGGYVGVDVFFVISGFLITRLIRDEVLGGGFSFVKFYERRARRLFPALFFTLVFALVGGFVLFTPPHFAELGASSIHALLSISNFYFWGESGYFDTDAFFKPLLHTWSLSVEEQFYLLWPALLVLLLSSTYRLVAPVFVIIAGSISLLLAQYWLQSDMAAAFYLLPFRVMEFAFGALLVFILHIQPNRKYLLEPVLLLGLGMIAYAVLTYDDKTLFPGINAILPCLGTFLVLYSGTASYSGKLLNNKLMVSVGLISYSFYLIHWPVIVFYRYLSYDLSDLGVPRMIGNIVITSIIFILAILMYYFVEKPFRHRSGKKLRLSAPAFGLACTFCALLLIFPAAHVWAEGGWAWRIPEEMREMLSADLEREKFDSWKYVIGDKSPGLTPFNSEATVKILVVGDSHSKDTFNSIYLNPQLYKNVDIKRLPLDENCLYLLSAGGKPEKSLPPQVIKGCEKDASIFKNSKLFADSDVILYSARWEDSSIKYIPDLADYVKSYKKPLVIFGLTSTFKEVPSKLAVQYGRIDGLDDFISKNRDKISDDKLNKKISLLAAAAHVDFIDRASLVCPPEQAKCDVLDHTNNHLFLFDKTHWTLEGAAHFGKTMAELHYLDKYIRLDNEHSS